MSSASSIRRPRDRNGVATNLPKTSPPIIKSLNTLTPVSISSAQNPNPRPHHRAVQRPSLRSVPAVDKTVVAGPRNAGRRSTSISSVPRGRSPSPSELGRVVKDSSRKGEIGGSNWVVSSVGKKNPGRKFGDCKENVCFGVELAKKAASFGEEDRILSGFKVLNGNLSLDSVKLREVDDVVKSGSDLNEKRMSDEGLKGRVAGVKYPSKLHDKLAFLEGKVKRIASDIKKTKEMLDANNPDSSKVILLDIQDKISGIEKAMGRVAAEPMKSSVTNGVDKIFVERVGDKDAVEMKGSIKALNSEELEARLFPHYKLLKDRTTTKLTAEIAQINSNSEVSEATKASELLMDRMVSKVSSESAKGNSDSEVMEASEKNELNVGDVTPIEENLISQKLLPSLQGEEAKTLLRDAKFGGDSCEAQQSGGAAGSKTHDSLSTSDIESGGELVLTTDETLDEFDDQEDRQMNAIDEENEDPSVYQLNEIGSKITTGGWFVSEGEAVLLAHDDGSCTFYDIANCEDKMVYKPPMGVSSNMWEDCWIIRAPSSDGCSGKYVVAASAGNSLTSGFCSWDFYGKDVRAFYTEDGETTMTTRTVLGPLPSNTAYRRNTLSSMLSPETQQWWYRPCGPLIVSASGSQRKVKMFDVRDGEQIMQWEVQKPVVTMDYSSPLQWRNIGKVVVAEAETISVWDVNSLGPQSLLSVSSPGGKISALHIINTDAEVVGGVRQRTTSTEAEGNDGVFCTADSINVLDFRQPTGIGLKIPKVFDFMQSVYTRGDSIYVGCTNIRSAGKKQVSSQVQHFSLRKQNLVNTYALPECNHSAITQVWGNSHFVMASSGQGLFVFDALKDEILHAFAVDKCSVQEVREVIGPDGLYSPSFDYLASRVLLISKDRPALWRIVL